MVESLVKSVQGEGDLLSVLEEEMRRQQEALEPSQGRKTKLVMERDALRQRLDRLIDLVAAGDAPGKAVAEKVGELQLSVDRLERDIAGCDAEIAHANMIATNAQMMLDQIRTKLINLAPEVRQQILGSFLAEAHIGLDRPMRLVFWPLGVGRSANLRPGNKTTSAEGSDAGREWLGCRDSNPDRQSQSLQSYR